MKFKISLTQNDYEIPLRGSTPYTYLAGRLDGDDSALMASYIELSQSTAPPHSTLPPVLFLSNLQSDWSAGTTSLVFFLTEPTSHYMPEKNATALQTPAPNEDGVEAATPAGKLY